jgi:S-adenosylmethionine/arginine decarboxylase-like enzyme
MSGDSEKDDNLTLQGQHLLADLFGVEGVKLKDPASLIRLFQELAAAANLPPSGEPYLARFGRGNCAGSIFLQDSHSRLSFNSFPDANYIAIDIFTSGDIDLEKIFSRLLDSLSPQMVRKTIISRGLQN